nr:Na+/H+ antiporter subunit E [Pseudomarimonas arenosa]
MRAIGLFIVLLVFWLLLSGLYTPFLIGAGVGTALFATWFGRRLSVVDPEGQPFQLGWRIFVYWLWLAGEVAKSSLTVARIVLHPKLPISPSLVRFKASQSTDLGRVIHANSITLTPGTLSIHCNAEEFLVHGLTREGAEGCVNSAMDRWVSRCEQGR